MTGDKARADRLCVEALALVEGTGEPIETRLLVELATQRARTRLGDPTVIDDAERAWAAASAACTDRAKARNLLGLTLAHNGRSGWEEHYLAAAEIAREDGDVEQGLAAMYWLVSCYGLYGPLQKAIEREEEMLAVTERLGLRRLNHHFLGAYLVHMPGSGTAPDELVGRARRLLVEDPLFRNRAQVDLVLSIGLVEHGDAGGARDVLEAGRRSSATTRTARCCASAPPSWRGRPRTVRRSPPLSTSWPPAGRLLRDQRLRRQRRHPPADRRTGRGGDPDLQCLDDAVRRRGRRRASSARLVEAGRSSGTIASSTTAAARWIKSGFVRFGAHAGRTAGRLAREAGDTDGAAQQDARGGRGAGRALAAGSDHPSGAEEVVPRARPRHPTRRC